MKSLFEQMETMLNLLIAVLMKLCRKFLQLASWNTTGLSQHMEELKTFISIHVIDIMLITETYFTEKGLPESSQL
jgi:hypothetical protein